MSAPCDLIRSVASAYTDPADLLVAELALAGCRPSEILALQVADFQVEPPRLRLTGKTGMRELPLSVEAAGWAAVLGGGRAEGPLLPGLDRERLQAKLRALREAAGDISASVHAFRHEAAIAASRERARRFTR